MLRASLLVVIACIGVSFVGVGGARPAFACSYAPFNPATDAEAVVYGRIDRLASLPAPGAGLLTIHTERTLLGPAQPEFLEVQTEIESPVTPCLAFEPDNLIGRPMVMALVRDGGGRLSTGRVLTWFVGDPLSLATSGALAKLLDAPPVTPVAPSAGSGATTGSSGTPPFVLFLAIGAAFLLISAMIILAGPRRDCAGGATCGCSGCRRRRDRR
jgi:hypothetical protein